MSQEKGQGWGLQDQEAEGGRETQGSNEAVSFRQAQDHGAASGWKLLKASLAFGVRRRGVEDKNAHLSHPSSLLVRGESSRKILAAVSLLKSDAPGRRNCTPTILWV